MRLHYIALLMTFIFQPFSFSMEPKADACTICHQVFETYQSKLSCKDQHFSHKSCAIQELARDFAGEITAYCPVCKENCEQEWMGSFDRVQFRELLNKLKQRTKNINIEIQGLHAQKDHDLQLLRAAKDAQIVKLQDDAEAQAALINSLEFQLQSSELKLKAAIRNNQTDNEFNKAILDHTKKRIALNAWAGKEQAQLNGYYQSWVAFSLLSVFANYASPYWTSFIANDQDRPDWKTRLPGVRYWGTMRTIFTQLPLYALGATMLDYKQYQLNMQEIDKRLELARECEYVKRIDELKSFKEQYKKMVIEDQVKFPLCAFVAGTMVPFIANLIVPQNNDFQTDALWSAGSGLFMGYVTQRKGADQNQRWFALNKPIFSRGIKKEFNNNGSILKREHTFSDDIPR